MLNICLCNYKVYILQPRSMTDKIDPNDIKTVHLLFKNAFEEYLISSAALLEVFKYFPPLFVIGSYKFFKILFTLDLSVPITILSGNIKSLMASPSLKNSGLETTSNNFFDFF